MAHLDFIIGFLTEAISGVILLSLILADKQKQSLSTLTELKEKIAIRPLPTTKIWDAYFPEFENLSFHGFGNSPEEALRNLEYVVGAVDDVKKGIYD